MRATRSIRNRGKRAKKEVMDIDITSLLDILVILLVFLLKSYNSSGLILNVPKGIELPKSASISINTPGVLVQVSPKVIWVEDKEILNLENPPRRYTDHGGRRIISLYNELVKKKLEIKRVEKLSDEAKKFSGTLNLIVDKGLKYSFLKKVMYTAAEAGYRRYKFVVLADEG